MATSYLDKWQPVADDVLSVLLVNPGRWEEIVNAGISSTDFPPGPWRAVFLAALDLAVSAAPGAFLPDTEVAIKAGAAVTIEWVDARIALHDSAREQMLTDQLKRLSIFGEGAQALSAVQRAQTLIIADLDNGTPVSGTVIQVMGDLQHAAQDDDGSADFGDIAQEAEAQFDKPSANVIETGVWVVDLWLDGIGETEYIAWAGPNKQRKTSVYANVMINLARQEKHLSVFSFDENRFDLYYRLQAVLMAQYSYEHGFYHLADEESGAPINIISRKILKRVGKGWRTWPEPLQEARLWAKQQLAALAPFIRVYDQSICPNRLDAITARCDMDAKRVGLDGVMLDHIQSMDGYDNDYGLIRDFSIKSHAIRGRHNCFMWILSQQNKAGIAGDDVGGWSSEMAGGPAVEQKADTIFVSKYKVGTYTDPRVLRVELRQARDEESQRFDYVEIHPPSGYITPRRDVLKHFGLKGEDEK